MTRRWRRSAALIALPLLLGTALWAPIPKVGDPGIEQLVGQVHARLPGWHVVRATDTWEGGYAVVAGCGSREMGFQVVHGHGLPAEDAWLQPNDSYARTRLEQVSDYPTFLIWRARPIIDRTLSCREELARAADAQPPTVVSSQTSRNTSVDGNYGGIEASRRRRMD